MRLGILTAFDEEALRFAAATGFECVELWFNPADELNARSIAEDGAGEKVRGLCDDLGLTISALACHQNNLDPDGEAREKNIKRLNLMIDAAAALDVPVVATFAGRDPSKTIEDNIPAFKKVFRPIAQHADEKRVKVAFENYPGMNPPNFQGCNIAISPDAWSLMFDAVPSKALGLEYDPSHLLLLECDYVAAIYEFGGRIVHVHAKDTEILEGALARKGIFDAGWWRYRIPGWGGVDWKRVFMALADVGYEGDMNIEHEDPVFDGPRRNEGFVRAYNFLSQFFFTMPEVPEPAGEPVEDEEHIEAEEIHEAEVAETDDPAEETPGTEQGDEQEEKEQ